jgi:hypothetical protein
MRLLVKTRCYSTPGLCGSDCASGASFAVHSAIYGLRCCKNVGFVDLYVRGVLYTRRAPCSAPPHTPLETLQGPLQRNPVHPRPRAPPCALLHKKAPCRALPCIPVRPSQPRVVRPVRVLVLWGPSRDQTPVMAPECPLDSALCSSTRDPDSVPRAKSCGKRKWRKKVDRKYFTISFYQLLCFRFFYLAPYYYYYICPISCF